MIVRAPDRPRALGKAGRSCRTPCPRRSTVVTSFAEDDFRVKAGLNSGPHVMARIGSGLVHTLQRINLRMRRAFKNIGVVAVETALELDHGDLAVGRRIE